MSAAVLPSKDMKISIDSNFKYKSGFDENVLRSVTQTNFEGENTLQRNDITVESEAAFDFSLGMRVKVGF